MATIVGPPQEEIEAVAIPAGPGTVPAEHPWPSAAAAWLAVALLAIAFMINMFDSGLTGFLIEMIKADFGASDFQMSLLTGVAPVIFYALIGLPMARLIDRYPRTIVLPLGSLFVGIFTGVCGLAQSFWQLFFGRMLVGSSATVNGPGYYSLLSDYFPPKKLARAIAGMQVGFVCGSAFAAALGGMLVNHAMGWGSSEWMGLVIKPWGKVYLIGMIGAFLVALMLYIVREPERRDLSTPKVAGQKAEMIPVSQVFAELWRRKGVYLPLFLSLAITSIEGGAIMQWRIPFLMRTYNIDPEQIGLLSGATSLVFSLAGLPLGAFLAERLQHKHDDAPIRAVLISWCLALPFSIASPLMPTAWLSILVAGIGSMFAMGSAISQNTAVQIITPNRMRAQVTAMYLFMFTVLGGFGAPLLTLVSGALGGEMFLGPAMAIVVGVMMPIAIFVLASALKPFAAEIRASREAGLI